MKVNLILVTMILCMSCSGPEAIRQRNDQIPLGMSEVDSGNLLYRRGCYRQSLHHFFRAFERFASSDNVSGTAMCLNNIGNVYHSLSDTDTALSFYDEAFAVYLTLEDQQGAIHALTNKAAALIDCDRLSKAADVLMKAEEISDQANISFPPLLTNTGLFLTKKQEFRNAEKVLNLALEKTDPQADSAIASVYFALGSLMLKTARYEESILFFQKALRADQEASFYKGIADDLSSTGDAMALLGQQKEASFYYKRSVMIYALINNQENKAATLHKLEKIAKQEGTDLSVINFFMDKWQKDGIGNTLCD